MADLKFELRTLTQIWTGGVEGKTDKLHLTGIKGSLRWWYEVLIRGLGYYACDPTDDSPQFPQFKKCEVKLTKEEKQQIESNPRSLQGIVKLKICPACYLFGCGGWSGKIILRITEPDSTILKESLFEGKIPFDLHFIEKKELEEEENILLNMTLKLILDYGAICGKTVFKPSEHPHKNSITHHKDFGIIVERDDTSGILAEKIRTENIDNYLRNFKKDGNGNNSDWPDLKNFWFVKDVYINRQGHNQLVDRNINTGKYNNGASSDKIFFGGFTSLDKEGVQDSVKETIEARENDTNRDTESKKVFSFHGQVSGMTRCFGYARNETEQEKIKKGVERILNAKGDAYTIYTGEEVLDEL